MLNLKNIILTATQRDSKLRCLQFHLGKSQFRSRGLGAYLMKNLVGIKFMMDNLIIQPVFFHFHPKVDVAGENDKTNYNINITAMGKHHTDNFISEIIL